MMAFHADELRDSDGKWTASSLLKHSIEVTPRGTVRWHGRVAGHVVKRGGAYQARAADGTHLSVHPTRSAAAAVAAAHHMAKGPTVLEWKDPPAPTGVGGRKAGGMTAIGITNTSLGDSVEAALQRHMGFQDAHPGRRQGRFDLLWNGNAYEVKAVSQSATEYKAKPKKHEVDEKLAYAKEHGLKPHVMIVVYHPKGQQLYVYSKAGVGAFRLTNPKAGWQFHGTVPLNLGQSWDPVNVSR